MRRSHLDLPQLSKPPPSLCRETYLFKLVTPAIVQYQSLKPKFNLSNDKIALKKAKICSTFSLQKSTSEPFFIGQIFKLHIAQLNKRIISFKQASTRYI